MSGRVSHFELPFDDGDRARNFYTELFGWQMQVMPDMGYTLVTSGPSTEEGPSEPGFINGGMLSRADSAAPGPVIVVEVDDLDATLGKVEGNGGKVLVGRTAVGDMGFSAYVRDPEGNVVGLWESVS